MTGDQFQAFLMNTLDMAYRGLSMDPNYMEWRNIYLESRADSGKGTYPFLGDVPSPGKRGGAELMYRGVQEYDYELSNDEFGQPGLSFPNRDVRRDRINTYGRVIDAYVRSIVRTPITELAAALSAGESRKAYDGSNFFVSTGNRANVINASGQSMTNIEADMTDAITAMALMKTDTGRLSRHEPDTIICHTALKIPMLKVVRSTAAPGTASNSGIRNIAGEQVMRVLTTPDLGSTDAAKKSWYFASTMMPLNRPLVWQWERMMAGSAYANYRSRIFGGGRFRAECWFNQEDDAWRFQVMTAGVAGYLLPELIVKVKGT